MLRDCLEANLVDPGLELFHDDDNQTFTVTATQGVSAWTWLNYPAGVVVTFSENGFWLASGEERVVNHNVTADTDTTGGRLGGTCDCGESVEQHSGVAKIIIERCQQLRTSSCVYASRCLLIASKSEFRYLEKKSSKLGCVSMPQLPSPNGGCPCVLLVSCSYTYTRALHGVVSNNGYRIQALAKHRLAADKKVQATHVRQPTNLRDPVA